MESCASSLWEFNRLFSGSSPCWVNSLLSPLPRSSGQTTKKPSSSASSINSFCPSSTLSFGSAVSVGNYQHRTVFFCFFGTHQIKGHDNPRLRFQRMIFRLKPRLLPLSAEIHAPAHREYICRFPQFPLIFPAALLPRPHILPLFPHERHMPFLLCGKASESIPVLYNTSSSSIPCVFSAHIFLSLYHFRRNFPVIFSSISSIFSDASARMLRQSVFSSPYR